MRPISAGPHVHGAHAPHQRGGGSAPAAGQARPAQVARTQDTFESALNPAAAYQQVSGALARDPAAQGALQQLNASGRLNAPGQGGGTLLGQLARLKGNPQLMAQVVKDVASPESIRQGKGNEFCGATTALAGMARNDPAGYAKLAADLALDGQARTPGGNHTLKAKPGGGPQGMSPTQRLMAPALTEAANGKRFDVNANGVSHAQGRHAPRDTRRVEGTFASGMERMQEMLEGGNHRSLYIPGKGEPGRARAANQAERLISRDLQGGEQPAVSAGGHWYRITGAGGGQLTVMDQQSGRKSTVNADQFLAGAEAVTVSAAAGQVAKPYRKHGKHEDPGGGGSTLGSQNPVEDRYRL